MAVAQFTDDAYNKNHAGASKGAGTLIGNWYEEQVVRDVTGEGRTVPQRHIPRSGLLKDFTKTPNSGPRTMDNTFERVYGPTTHPMPMPSTKAASIYEDPKVEKEGPKEELMRSRRLEEAERLVQMEEADIDALANARDFSTTHGRTFTEKFQVEPCAHLHKSCRNELATGSSPDPSLSASNEGITRPANVHYSNMEAVTIHRMAVADPAMRNDMKVSASGGISVFGKHSEFTRPISEFTQGDSKDETVGAVYDKLKETNPMRTLGGSQPRGGGAFASVPSLAALKESVQMQIARVFGPPGFVVLRQELFNASGLEGNVSKDAVVSIFRDPNVLQLSTDEVSEMALDVYLSQMCTTKGDELRISTLMSSLRPALSQRDKLRVLDRFQALGPIGGTGGVGGSASLRDWLDTLEDVQLKEVITTAVGMSGASADSARVSERAFLELCTDLAPLVDLSSVL